MVERGRHRTAQCRAERRDKGSKKMPACSKRFIQKDLVLRSRKRMTISKRRKDTENKGITDLFVNQHQVKSEYPYKNLDVLHLHILFRSVC